MGGSKDDYTRHWDGNVYEPNVLKGGRYTGGDGSGGDGSDGGGDNVMSNCMVKEVG